MDVVECEKYLPRGVMAHTPPNLNTDCPVKSGHAPKKTDEGRVLSESSMGDAEFRSPKKILSTDAEPSTDRRGIHPSRTRLTHAAKNESIPRPAPLKASRRLDDDKW